MARCGNAGAAALFHRRSLDAASEADRDRSFVVGWFVESGQNSFMAKLCGLGRLLVMMSARA